jgi:drug/metabolite transporter (DMT)-like permease
MTKNKSLFLIIISLLAVYSIWSSTYLAIRIMVQGAPPLLSSGSRFFFAGLLLYLYQLLQGNKQPDRKLWWQATLTGTLFMLGGTGFVCLAEQWVSSGLAAIAISSTPLWTCLLFGLTGHWPNKLEWVGLFIGFTGIVLLNLDQTLQANFAGAVFLLLAPFCWSLGAILSKRSSLPPGNMTNAMQMLTGGLASMLIAFVLGERITQLPSWSVLLAWSYLVIFGSLIGFSAFMYLLHHVRPALATSYSYINPVLAVILGATLAGEIVSTQIILAMAITICGIIFVLLGHRGN